MSKSATNEQCPEQLMSISSAAATLGTGPAFILELIKADHLTVVKVRHSYRVPAIEVGDIAKFFEAANVTRELRKARHGCETAYSDKRCKG